MGCFLVELNRLGNTPTPTLERVGATPTAEVEYLGGYRAASGSLTRNYQGRVYFFRITEGDTPIIDYYPCKRKSDGVEGFWDCVSQTFVESI